MVRVFQTRTHRPPDFVVTTESMVDKCSSNWIASRWCSLKRDVVLFWLASKHVFAARIWFGPADEEKFAASYGVAIGARYVLSYYSRGVYSTAATRTMSGEVVLTSMAVLRIGEQGKVRVIATTLHRLITLRNIPNGPSFGVHKDLLIHFSEIAFWETESNFSST